MIRLKYRGQVFLGNNKELLYDNIIEYYKNKTPVDSDLKRIINIHSTGHPQNKNIEGKKKHKKKIYFKDAVSGAKAILSNAVGLVVSQDEINRRSGICQTCIMKDSTSDCMACGFANKLSGFMNRLKKSFGMGFVIPNNLDGTFCHVCSCALAIMLPSKLSAFNETPEKQAERPDHCWIKKTSSNYQP